MVRGEVVSTVELAGQSGQPFTVEILRPTARCRDNALKLRAVSDRWDDDARVLNDEPEAQARSYFAASVAFRAAMKVLEAAEGVLVAQTPAGGEVLGVALYQRAAGNWELSDLALAPRRQANSLNTEHVRGIGTSLFQAVARDMLSKQCSEIELTALDDAAARFWRARGFHNDAPALHMSCPELQTIVVRFDEPERIDLGDVPMACKMDEWRQCELPEVRELLKL